MTNSELQTLKDFLDRNGGLDDGYNRDLMEDALNAGAGTYRCEQSLKTLAHNLRIDGKNDLADNIDYYIK